MSDTLPEIPGIYSNKAINENGCSNEDYIDLLNLYYRLIDKKYSEIETAYNNKDINNFTIYVHALKSSSRLIGAYEFAEYAYKLEMSGRQGNIEEIITNTPHFLEEYRKLKLLIEPFIICKNTVNTIDRIYLLFLLEDLRDYLSDNSIVLINDCIGQLKNCYYNDEVSELTNELTELIDNAEYSQCVDIINRFIDSFTE